MNRDERLALADEIEEASSPVMFDLALSKKDRETIVAILRSQAGSEVRDVNDTLGYAQRLATSIWGKHFKADSPHWKPLPDLMGVLTQLDNMSTGLTRSPPTNAALVWALEYLEGYDHTGTGSAPPESFVRDYEEKLETIRIMVGKERQHPRWKLGQHFGRTDASPREDRRCQKCGTETHGEEAYINGQVWCHPCADALTEQSNG